MTQTNNIIYLVHGAKKFYDQAHFSLLTLLDLLIKQQRNDCAVYIYCDRPEKLPQHPLLHYITTNSQQLASWRGPLEYVHRIKLEILCDATNRNLAPFIFVDGDTRWLKLPDAEFSMLKDPAPITNKPNIVMHRCEGELSSRLFPHYLDYFELVGTKQLATWNVQYELLQIWNSGAIGVPSQQARTFFTHALAISDLLFPNLHPRNFVEQCAVSLLANSHFNVHPLNHCLHHYWDHSHAASIYLNRLFRDLDPALTLEQQADFCGKIQWNTPSIQALQKKPLARMFRWMEKVKNSYHKRRIDIKVAKLRAQTPQPFTSEKCKYYSKPYKDAGA